MLVYDCPPLPQGRSTTSVVLCCILAEISISGFWTAPSHVSLGLSAFYPSHPSASSHAHSGQCLHAPNYKSNMTGESQTSNAFVQVPLSFSSITSAEGLSVRGVEKAVIIEGWFSVGKGERNLKLGANYWSRYQLPSYIEWPKLFNTRVKHYIFGKKKKTWQEIMFIPPSALG